MKSKSNVTVDGYTGLVDVSGAPLMSGGGYAGARFSRELATWAPALRSADADLLPDIKTLSARSNDLSRNYAVAHGSIESELDYVIGSGLRLSAKPDWRFLGLDVEWAAEWSRDVESKFRTHAEDPDCYSDASRKSTFAARVGLAFRTYLINGEVLSVAEWLPDRGSVFSTAVQQIEPARLSNPYDSMDTNKLRGGVELGKYGEPLAYHFRTSMQSDIRFSGSDVFSWKRVPRYHSWGRRQVEHIFDVERPSQTRGKTGFASVLSWAKRIEKFQDVSLEAAIINSIYAATIETDFNYAQAAEALGAESIDQLSSAAAGLASDISDFHSDKSVRMDGVKIPHLFPGERLNFTTSQNPGPNFSEFEKSAMRHFAAGRNLSYEFVSRNNSDTSYSGARAGMQQIWKNFDKKRSFVGGRYGSFEYELWLEEAIDKGIVKLPQGAPDFYEAKSAYCKCSWGGPGRDEIDGLKEAKARQLKMDTGELTFEDACAEGGKDWEANLEQIAREKKRREELGLTMVDVRGYMAPDAPAN